MSTRAVILRKNNDCLELFQTKQDGYYNTNKLNEICITQNSINKLFELGKKYFIKNLNFHSFNELEETIKENYKNHDCDDSYNYELISKDDLDSIMLSDVNYYFEYFLDSAEYVSIWDANSFKWVNYSVIDSLDMAELRAYLRHIFNI